MHLGQGVPDGTSLSLLSSIIYPPISIILCYPRRSLLTPVAGQEMQELQVATLLVLDVWESFFLKICLQALSPTPPPPAQGPYPVGIECFIAFVCPPPSGAVLIAWTAFLSRPLSPGRNTTSPRPILTPLPSLP